MFKYYTLLLSLLCFNSALLTEVNANSLDKGRDAFANNNIEEAETYFLNALESAENEERKEVLTMLAIIKSFIYDDSASLPYVKKLYESEGNADPYLYALWDYNPFTPSFETWGEERVELFKSIAEDEEVNSAISTMAKGVLSGYYWYNRDVEKYAQYGHSMGDIYQWQVTGEFENISASGFDKIHDPVNNPEQDASFTGKYNTEIKWHTLTKHTAGEWLDYDYHFTLNNAIVYAQTFVKSPVSQQVQIRIGGSGSLQLWVNDNQAFSRFEERSVPLDSYVINVELEEGWNRILIQSGTSQMSNARIFTRITDNDGKPLDLETSSEYKPYNADAEVNAEKVPHFAASYFREMIKDRDDEFFPKLMLFKTLLLQEDIYEAKHVNETLKVLGEQSSYIYALKEGMYVIDYNQQSATRVIEHIKDIDPEGRIAYRLLFNEAIDNENYRRAENYLDKIEEAEGESAYVLKNRIQLADLRGNHNTLIFHIEEAYSRFPQYFEVAYLQASVEIHVNNDLEAAENILKSYTEQYNNLEAQLKLAEFYFERGRQDEGFAIFDRLLDDYPFATGLYYQKAEQHFTYGNYDKARQLYKQGLEQSPYNAVFHKRIGNTYEEEEAIEEAVEKYKYALQLNPVDYETRRKKRDLLGQKKPFEYFDFSEEDIYHKIENAPESTDYPDDNSLVLIDENQKVFYEEGASEEKRYLAAKVFNSSGVDVWKEFGINRYPNQYLVVEKAEVVKQNGNRISADRNDNQIVFTNLEPGDAIVMIYRKQNYYAGVLSNHFWDTHYFIYSEPRAVSRYSLLISKGQNFDYKTTGTDVQPEVTEKDEHKLYTWTLHDLTSPEDENLRPPQSDFAPLLHISTFPGWNFVNEWYNDLSMNKSRTNYEVEQLAEKLIEDEEDLSESEIAKRIYDYIVEEIRYSSVNFRQSGLIPQEAGKVINTRVGDCKDVSVLFVALAKELGLDANIVLINTRERGKNRLALPSIDFNHAIVRLVIDGEEHYYELTTDLFAPGTFGRRLKNSFALNITGPHKTQEPIYLDPPTRIQNSMIRESKVYYSMEEEQLVIEKQTNRNGFYSAAFRNTYRDDNQRERNFARNVIAERTDAAFDEVQFRECLHNSDPKVIYDYSYFKSDPFTSVSTFKVYDLPWSDALSPRDFLSEDDRQYPLELWRVVIGDLYKETMVFHIPEGMELLEMPESVSLSSPAASYELTFELKGNELHATRKLKYYKHTVSVEEFEDFRTFYSEILRHDETQIVLQPL